MPDYAKEEIIDGILRRSDRTGRTHSLRSPAWIAADGTKLWYKHNKRHRLDGPAVEYPSGEKEWWINANLIGRSFDGFTQEDFEKYKKEGVFEMPDYIKEEIYASGEIRRYDSQGLLHGEGIPAIENPSGLQMWYSHGNLHREDGPASIYGEGSQEWFQEGNLHRLDGPASELEGGRKFWYIKGECIGKSADGFTQEDFENYRKEHGI